MTSPRLTEDDLRTFKGKREKQRVRGGVEGHAGDAMRAHDSVGMRTTAKNRQQPSSDTAPAPSKSKPKYKSKWEATYASKLELEKQAGLISHYWYEPFSLWLPGKVRYKPDFMVERSASALTNYALPPLEIIEVKGWSKNRRDGMTRLKIAAAIYSCFVWRLVYRTKYGWWDGENL